jgi:SOS-response transcriptional repressor LexA
LDDFLDAFTTFHEQHGRPPSLRELAAVVGVRSPMTVKHALDLLVQRGDLARVPDRRRLASAYRLRPRERGRHGIDPERLLREYREACIAAHIDPETGPQTRYEAVLAISAARRRRRRTPGMLRWWQVDWSDPGTCRSDVEYEAFFGLFVAAQRRFSLHRDE